MTEKTREPQSDPAKKPAPRREKHGAGAEPGRHKYGTASEVKPLPHRQGKEKS